MSAGRYAELDDRGLPAAYPFKPHYECCPRDAAHMFERGEALLVDVRLSEELQAARLAESIPQAHAPLHELHDHLDDIEDLARGRPILTLCHHGVRSIKAALALRSCGMGDTRSIAGGIDLWAVAIDPSVPRYERDGADCRVIP